MFISSSKITISTYGCNSLKEKRTIVKSIINSVKVKFNVSISEVDLNDNLTKALLGVTFTSNEKEFSERMIEKVISFIEKRYPGQIDNYDLEIYYR